jgi:hypothetical protein
MSDLGKDREDSEKNYFSRIENLFLELTHLMEKLETNKKLNHGKS